MPPGSDRRFPRTARLTRPQDFQQVFAGRVKSSDKNLMIAAILNPGPRARLGLAISKKVSPRAVIRNRLKRVIRECFRHEQAQLGNVDFVVVGRPGLHRLSADKLRASLHYHWRLLSRRLCENS